MLRDNAISVHFLCTRDAIKMKNSWVLSEIREKRERIDYFLAISSSYKIKCPEHMNILDLRFFSLTLYTAYLILPYMWSNNGYPPRLDCSTNFGRVRLILKPHSYQYGKHSKYRVTLCRTTGRPWGVHQGVATQWIPSPVENSPTYPH